MATVQVVTPSPSTVRVPFARARAGRIGWPLERWSMPYRSALATAVATESEAVERGVRPAGALR